MRPRLLTAIISAVLFLTAAAVLFCCGNNPWPRELVEGNTLFSSYGIAIKTLDPQVSYYEHETILLDSIVEMPFEYHYLKRPYELKPMLAEEMPVPQYFDAQGKRLPEDADAKLVARTEYTIRLKRGVMYQPHPCFATDASGAFFYLKGDAQFPKCKSPLEFPHLGTREMTAADMRLALLRICDPGVSSPVYSNLKSFIVGMEECSRQIAEKRKQLGEAFDYSGIELKGVEIIDEHTLKYVLSRKYPQAIYWMAMHFFSPVPWEALAFYNTRQVRDLGLSYADWPVGTGAYMLTQFEAGNKIILKRNPNYHDDFYPSDGAEANDPVLADAGHKTPFIDTCYYLFERESIPGWIKFNQGYYDAHSIPNDVFDSATSINANGGMGLSSEMLNRGISLDSEVRLVSYYYGFNQLDPVFGGNSESAVKLRRAISMVIDCQANVDVFANGRGQAAQGIIPPGLPGGEVNESNFNSYVFTWDKTEGKPKLRSLEEARQLMAEAGYPNGIGKDGKRLRINYDHSSAGNPAFKSQFLWLKDSLASIGIELIDNGSDLNRFRDKMLTGNWQFMRKGWVADYPDPENFLFLFYSQNAHVPSKGKGANYTNYSNPEFDRLFIQLEAMPNGEERNKLILKALDILRRDAPCVWDFHPTSFELKHAWLKNFRTHGIGNTFLRYRKIDVDARSAAQKSWNRPPYGWLLLLCAVLCLLPLAVQCFRH